jgi:hypothetical protein
MAARTKRAWRKQRLTPTPAEARRRALELGEALDECRFANASLAAHQGAATSPAGGLVEQASKVAQKVLTFEEVSAHNSLPRWHLHRTVAAHLALLSRCTLNTRRHIMVRNLGTVSKNDDHYATRFVRTGSRTG